MALAALALAGLAAHEGSAPAAPAPTVELLPDLVTLRPGPLELERRGRRVRVRLGNRVANRGRGPLELAPQRGDCDADGDATDDRRAYQRVYLDRDRSGRFSPRVDRRFHRYRASCTRFHPRHYHWHYDDFSRYEVRRPSDGVLLRSSSKVSFCLIDTFREGPRRRRGGLPLYFLCDRDVVQGISAGWGDEYGLYLPGQHVDVTGLRRGAYCLFSVADPSNTIREADELNNVAATGIVLRPRSVRAVRDARCAASQAG
jgi:hypothetical protein